jgi:MoaA/NifB/PqqE/SkfB family radical SAM enzyme
MIQDVSERLSINELCCYRNILNNKKRLIWEITSKCNLSCKHCFINTNLNKDISFQECLKIIDMLKKNKMFGKVMITGGEPFIREDIFELLLYIKKIYQK